MALLGSVDIPFTKSTKIAVDATDTAGQAQATAQTASQTATQAAATASGAAQAAQTAITTANGKNKAYYGATTPTNPQPGDIWFVEDGSNNVTAIKHYDGTQWITDVDNTALAQQISAAQAAADNAVTVGQAAQQTAADAEAKGDAAAKTAEEAKDAATKAQADAASAVTSANNAVNTANKATQDAQDAIDKAQDGFDAAQDALSKAGAAVDTANTAKQVASDAATQANTAKTNAQTAMSNAQDAINKANAANANANTREKSIIKSNTAPSNPATDQLWIDTSKTPQIMRRWNGSAWVDLSPTQASQIGAVSTTTYTTDITNINNTLSQKASVETVNTLSGRVDKAETAITQNANNIALKADKSVVDTLKNTVDNHSTLISQNADAIQLKADKSTVDSLTGRVSTAEATLTAQANEIAARITKTEADGKYATQTALTATANSLTSSISAVQTNLNNLQVGVRNLALQTGNPFTMSSFSNINNQTAKVYDINQNELNGHVYISCDVTVSGIVGDSTTGTPGMRLQFYTRDNNNTSRWDAVSNIPLTDGTYKISVPLSANYTAGYKEAYVQLRADYIKSGTVTVKNFMVTIGNKYVGWTPAPEDLATQSQITQLSNDINLRVKQNDVINQINISTEGILIDGKKVHITGRTTIDNAVIKDAMIQSMTANKLTAGTIDANVITVKNINASNIVTGTLDASKATVTNIDASKITTGTLNAARIAAGSIDASKLNVSSLSALSANLGSVTAGNISGVNINIGNGNFTVDTSGNLVAKNANITGTINATSGTFSGVLEGATGTFKGQMTAGSINIGSNFSVDSNGNLTAKSGTFSGVLNGATFAGNTINVDSELNVRNGNINVTSTTPNPWGYYDSVKIDPTYRFPIHVEDNDSYHVYISSGIIEVYSPGDSDLNVPPAKLTIDPAVITFSNGTNITSDAIYAADYINGESRIDNKGNAQFRNIKLNGYHSIISLDGGGLYFTNANGDRIDINAKWVRPNNMAFGYHTIASLDGEKLFFTNNTSNGNRIDIGIATLDYSGSLSKSSSETLKSNIEPISFSAINEIMKTDFYSYNYISDLDRGITKPNFGPVIGDKYHLSDKFLSPDGDSVSIDNATFINSQAIKELYKDIQKQNQQIVLKIADLEARLAKLEE